MYVLIKPAFSGYNEQCMLIQKMYRMDNFKIIDAQEAKMLNNFKCLFKVCINSDCAFGWYTK
jgi:hypothetical protein